MRGATAAPCRRSPKPCPCLPACGGAFLNRPAACTTASGKCGKCRKCFCWGSVGILPTPEMQEVQKGRQGQSRRTSGLQLPLTVHPRRWVGVFSLGWRLNYFDCLFCQNLGVRPLFAEWHSVMPCDTPRAYRAKQRVMPQGPAFENFHGAAPSPGVAISGARYFGFSAGGLAFCFSFSFAAASASFSQASAISKIAFLSLAGAWSANSEHSRARSRYSATLIVRSPEQARIKSHFGALNLGTD